MFDITTWKLSILEHLKQFTKNNKVKQVIKFINLDDIKNDNKLDNFLKDIFIMFNNFYECKNQIRLDYSVLGYEQSNYDSYFIGKSKFILDFNLCLETSKVNISDTETDKNILNLFNQ